MTDKVKQAIEAFPENSHEEGDYLVMHGETIHTALTLLQEMVEEREDRLETKETMRSMGVLCEEWMPKKSDLLLTKFMEE